MADHPHCIHLDLVHGAVCCFCGIYFLVKATPACKISEHGRFLPQGYAFDVGPGEECGARAFLEDMWQAEFN